MAGGWLRDMARVLLPSGCVSCGRWIPEGRNREPELVCAPCRARMRRGTWPRCPRCHWPRGTRRSEAVECRECASWPESIVAARFAFELRPPVDDLVHGLKYEGWRELAPMMGAAMARLELSWPEGTLEPPVAVPIPTTRARLRTRGYNQATLLADSVASVLGLRVVHALERTRASRSQTALTPEARRRNVRGAFHFRSMAAALRGRPVVLVDDVLTTGATVSAAAECLVDGGAGPVAVVTFARAVDRGARVAA